MSDRISLADDGTLDEIVAGQAHLECLDRRPPQWK